MPEWLPALLEVAPQVGVGALLAWLLLRVWGMASADRGAYERGMAAAQQRYTNEIRELERKVDRLTVRIEELNKMLDDERSARRLAQDAAWQVRQSDPRKP